MDAAHVAAGNVALPPTLRGLSCYATQMIFSIHHHRELHMVPYVFEFQYEGGKWKCLLWPHFDNKNLGPQILFSMQQQEVEGFDGRGLVRFPPGTATLEAAQACLQQGDFILSPLNTLEAFDLCETYHTLCLRVVDESMSSVSSDDTFDRLAGLSYRNYDTVVGLELAHAGAYLITQDTSTIKRNEQMDHIRNFEMLVREGQAYTRTSLALPPTPKRKAPMQHPTSSASSASSSQQQQQRTTPRVITRSGGSSQGEAHSDVSQ